MEDTHSIFDGSVPEAYDEFLGPLLFEFSAADIAKRVASLAPDCSQLLEVACGTGISTEFLRKGLSNEVKIVATDLNPAMMDFARQRRGALEGVRYELANALALPFEDQSFDTVVCQFGIMFFPDIPKGLSEMHRVLRSGGLLACNVWDSLEANKVAEIAHLTISEYFSNDPPTFLSIPFGSCNQASTMEMIREAGFNNVESKVVEAVVQSDSANAIARGFVEGNPGIIEIRNRARAKPKEIVRAVASRIEEAFGPVPLQLKLREFVFTGRATENREH